ncbi:MAG: hypothetical protein E5Y60_11415 [Mesorhizobium sp.]|nr:MAG: hypothetical protein E5Y60_11415 [Mesorhizobium sp.]
MTGGGRLPQMEPAQRLIEELEKEWTEEETIHRRWREDGVKFDLERPERLDIRAITLMPELFQPRDGISEKHLADLTKAIKNFGELDPLTVIVVSKRTILIDGHHRVEAYRRVWSDREVPIRYFEGSPSEAVLAASEANSAVKLPMESRERQNRAWKLVLIGRYTNMAKMFSTKMADNPQVAALALEKYFGRRLPEVWRELREFVDVREIELEEAEEKAAVEAEEDEIEAVLSARAAAEAAKTAGPDEGSRHEEF